MFMMILQQIRYSKHLFKLHSCMLESIYLESPNSYQPKFCTYYLEVEIIVVPNQVGGSMHHTIQAQHQIIESRRFPKMWK